MEYKHAIRSVILIEGEAVGQLKKIVEEVKDTGQSLVINQYAMVMLVTEWKSAKDFRPTSKEEVMNGGLVAYCDMPIYSDCYCHPEQITFSLEKVAKVWIMDSDWKSDFT